MKRGNVKFKEIKILFTLCLYSRFIGLIHSNMDFSGRQDMMGMMVVRMVVIIVMGVSVVMVVVTVEMAVIVEMVMAVMVL